MSKKFTLTAILAIAVFLIAAAVVYGQGTIQGNVAPRGMMQVPYTTVTPGTPTTPSTGTNGTTPADPANGTQYGPGMMGNGSGYGPGMMGNIDNADYQAMRDAMQSGNWQDMQNACQNAIGSGQTQQAPQTSAPAPTTTRGRGMMAT